VELFAEIRRDRRVDGLSIRALADRHGVHRRTVRQALESAIPPARRGSPLPKLRGVLATLTRHMDILPAGWLLMVDT